MRLSVVQMNPGHVLDQNIIQARSLIDAVCDADRPDIVALPEMWSCLGGDRAAKLAAAEALPPPAPAVPSGARRSAITGSNLPGGPIYEFLRGVARTRRIHVHGGSIGERDGDRLFNTTVVFDPDGTEIARYRKIHLFDIVTPDGTGYCESASFGAGEQVVVCEIRDSLVGLAICYDLRFPELFLALRRAGAELVFLPAAFTVQTGRDHWETLIRARAIETQCWFAAPATWGRHRDSNGEPRFTFGHSLVCDPWGQVVAKVSDGRGWATVRIDQALTAQVRRDMPILEHRKLA